MSASINAESPCSTVLKKVFISSFRDAGLIHVVGKTGAGVPVFESAVSIDGAVARLEKVWIEEPFRGNRCCSSFVSATLRATLRRDTALLEIDIESDAAKNACLCYSHAAAENDFEPGSPDTQRACESLKNGFYTDEPELLFRRIASGPLRL